MATIYGSSFDSTTLTNLLNKCLPKIKKDVADAISTESAYLNAMKSIGGVEYGVTGEGMCPKFWMKRNDTVAARTLTSPIPLRGQDDNRIGFQNPGQYSGSFTVDPLLAAQASGPEKIFNYVSDGLDSVRKTLAYQMNYDLLNGSGTLPTVDGLTSLIAETVTSGTLHGIGRSGNTWFRNQSKDSSCSTTVGFGVVVLKDLDELIKLASPGMGDKSLKLAVMDDAIHANLLYYGLGTNNLTQNLVVNNGGAAKIQNTATVAEESSVYIRAAKCIWDHDAPGDSIRLINPDIVKISFVKDWDVKLEGPTRALDSFALSYIIGCSFYHMNNDPKHTGVLYNFNA